MFILGEKLFYTFSHVINPKSLNLTSQGMDPDLFGSITVGAGRISDIHPLNKIWSALVEPLTLAGSWSPSSLLMNLGAGSVVVILSRPSTSVPPVHERNEGLLLDDHFRVEVDGHDAGALGPLLDSLRVEVEACYGEEDGQFWEVWSMLTIYSQNSRAAGPQIWTSGISHKVEKIQCYQ